LQHLADLSLELCEAHSAGVSILTEIDSALVFRWDAVAGQFARFLRGTLPREFSPCRTVLDTDAMQLMRHLDLHFSYHSDISPLCAEVLLTPFHVDGKPVGTVWVVSHDEARKFDAYDSEVMRALAEFAAAAYATATTQEDLKRALELKGSRIAGPKRHGKQS
jgi:GAF domain-containing protein